MGRFKYAFAHICSVIINFTIIMIDADKDNTTEPILLPEDTPATQVIDTDIQATDDGTSYKLLLHYFIHLSNKGYTLNILL